MAKRLTLKQIVKNFKPARPKAAKYRSPIIKREGKYCVRSVYTGKILSCHSTLRDAYNRLITITRAKFARRK